MRRLASIISTVALAAACSGQPYQPSYGFALENLYPDGVPETQQRLLADGQLTEQELEGATRAADGCVAAVPGIASVEPYRWVEQEGRFDGGTVELEEGADRETAIRAAQECYIEYVGLIDFAWRDQYYFGEWTEENLLD
jgi:hypothetical protein